MIEASAGYVAAALAGGSRRVRVTATDPAGAPWDIPVEGGELLLSSASYTRAELSLTVPGLRWAPRGPGDPLAPVGSRLAVDYGLQVAGQVEWARIATVWVDSADPQRPAGTVAVRASSRSARVTAAGLLAPAQPRPAETCLQMARRIVEEALGTAVTTVVDPAVADVAAPAAASFTGDPWQAVEALADVLGCETYFDRLDRLATRPVPVLGTPVLTLDAAHVTGTWVVLERSRAANHVRVVFTSPAGEVVGESADTDPGSPTRVGGPMGRVLYEETRPGPVTQGQADAAAQAVLVRMLGLFQRCGADLPGVPAVEPGDTVLLRHPGGLDVRYLVGQHTIPLDGSPARLDLRSTLIGAQAPA